jgi:2-hydroxychromene-2-carboxylate isomerase
MLRFCFDYISPYAYLGWTQIHALAARHGEEVEAVPVLFAGLLGAAGSKGPAEIPPKRIYVFVDCVRSAHRLGVSLAPPPAHPFNPLLALRVTGLVADPAERRALIDALFAATWGGSPDTGSPGVERPEAIAAIATGVGLDGPALVAAAGSPDAKERIKRNTDEAIAAGAFGVPTVFVLRPADSRPGPANLFWGLDSFANLEAHLRGEVAPALAGLDRWKDLGASAQRKQA